MEYTEKQIIDKILKDLYSVGGYLRFSPSLMHNHNISFELEDCNTFASILKTLELCEVVYKDKIPIMKITKQGIEIIQMYGSYSLYLDSKKRETSTEMQTKELTKHNIRLNNWKLSIALIAAIISLIVSIFAILKSSNTIEELRELLHQNGIEDITH